MARAPPPPAAAPQPAEVASQCTHLRHACASADYLACRPWPRFRASIGMSSCIRLCNASNTDIQHCLDHLEFSVRLLRADVQLSLTLTSSQVVILSIYTVHVPRAVLMAILGTATSRGHTLHGGIMSITSGGNSPLLVARAVQGCPLAH
jgi:hypothetical protein